MNVLILVMAAVLSGLFSGASMAAEKTRESAVAVMYHHFGDERYPTTNVRIDQFEAHLDFLAREGFQVWPLAKVVEAVKAKKPLPDKVIAITMDDAYASVYTEAYPRLKARGWPFTVFVSTDYIDRHFSNYMSWAQMAEMARHGASFGNHSSRHDYMVRLRKDETKAQWRKRAAADIAHAQARLKEELSSVVPFFAYPYGEYDLDLADVVKAQGLIGFGQQSGPIGFTSDLRFLPRFPVNEHYGDMEGLKAKLLSLAMPVTEITPEDPLTDQKRPRMLLTLGDADMRLGLLACYATGQGRIEVAWLDREARKLAVQAKADLGVGRSRYNCTAPSSEAGRYYWFSQPWLREPPPAAVEADRQQSPEE